ncbi:MAG: hypothetical protein IT555_07215 [Acetobacteraceae bacterium]|nr:hypothetical protein [Acetobacteraceae bacterium]
MQRYSTTADVGKAANPVTAAGQVDGGEAGTVRRPPAAANAILDALAPMGALHIDLTATAETVWRASPKAVRRGAGSRAPQEAFPFTRMLKISIRYKMAIFSV